MCVDHKNWWRHGTCDTQQKFVKSGSFLRDIVVQKNVPQRNIKGSYVALPHRMARFSIKEHNEHRWVDKYEV